MTRLFVVRREEPYPRLTRWVALSRLPFLERLANSVARDSTARRNPRDRAYMEKLAAEVFPDFSLEQTVHVNEDTAPTIDWAAADEIVLLWPDGNGTGWSGVERVIFARKRASGRVVVLSGPRRRFSLDPAARNAFRWRRFLEKTLAAEIAFLVAFVVLTPWLLLSDLVRRRP